METLREKCWHSAVARSRFGAWEFPLSRAEQIERLLYVLHAEADIWGQQVDSLQDETNRRGQQIDVLRNEILTIKAEWEEHEVVAEDVCTDTPVPIASEILQKAPLTPKKESIQAHASPCSHSGASRGSTFGLWRKAPEIPVAQAVVIPIAQAVVVDVLGETLASGTSQSHDSRSLQKAESSPCNEGVVMILTPRAVGLGVLQGERSQEGGSSASSAAQDNRGRGGRRSGHRGCQCLAGNEDSRTDAVADRGACSAGVLDHASAKSLASASPPCSFGLWQRRRPNLPGVPESSRGAAEQRVEEPPSIATSLTEATRKVVSSKSLMDTPSIELLESRKDIPQTLEAVRRWARTAKAQGEFDDLWYQIGSAHREAIFNFLSRESEGSIRRRRAREVLSIIESANEALPALSEADLTASASKEPQCKVEQEDKPKAGGVAQLVAKMEALAKAKEEAKAKAPLVSLPSVLALEDERTDEAQNLDEIREWFRFQQKCGSLAQSGDMLTPEHQRAVLDFLEQLPDKRPSLRCRASTVLTALSSAWGPNKVSLTSENLEKFNSLAEWTLDEPSRDLSTAFEDSYDCITADNTIMPTHDLTSQMAETRLTPRAHPVKFGRRRAQEKCRIQ
mmetsp:Transcript_160087/g.292258  ORF Transcript_160087/g.292258 Transcript_160087/m.292258 type:complete len:622 (-) Transcript_160087:20-1885(-)